MEDRLDVVALGVADEGAVIAGMVFGPQSRLVQRFDTERQGGVEERLNRFGVLGRERDVHLPVGPIGVAGRGVGDPERGLAVGAVTDGFTEIHHPVVAQDVQDLVVELLGFDVVGAVDSEVIDHTSIVTGGCDVMSSV